MKNILKTLTFIFTLLFSTVFASAQTPSTPSAPELPLGPKMIVWALGQAHDGTLSVSGDGLTSSKHYEIDLRSARTLDEMLGFFDFEGILLQYKNPDPYTITTGEIRDVDGQILFRAEHWWKLVKIINDGGSSISYSVPEWSANLWFSLQDIRVPFGGESATAYLSNGAVISLDVFDGKVTLPAKLSWSHTQGVVEMVHGGQKFYRDINTGAQITDFDILAHSRGQGINNIKQLESSGMSVWAVAHYYGSWYNPTFETVPSSKGWFTIYVTPWDQWTVPVGVWVKVGLNGDWKYFSEFQKGDPLYIQTPVDDASKNSSLYFRLEWGPSAGKG